MGYLRKILAVILGLISLSLGVHFVAGEIYGAYLSEPHLVWDYLNWLTAFGVVATLAYHYRKKRALDRQQHDQNLESSIQAMEMAFRMQFAAPEAFDVSQESKATRELYGDSEYAKGCLLARRLVERGVRMVQVSHSIDHYDIAWDTGHSDIAGGHKKLADACDRGIAALIKDLKQRGMLDETLVIWGGEFGRAPTSEGQKGRDHDHYGFTVWMAGGGVKGGFSYGATDQFGLTAVENRVHVHDLHATILHLMGIDHERLTYRYSGRDFRLTDVHGKVVHDIIA